jgi:hypothetical protein
VFVQYGWKLDIPKELLDVAQTIEVSSGNISNDIYHGGKILASNTGLSQNAAQIVFEQSLRNRG